MAVNFEKLIDLPLLVYYDELLKQWVTGEIEGAAGAISFGELPEEGKENILYITEDSILVWNGEDYTPLNSNKEINNTWNTF